MEKKSFMFYISWNDAIKKMDEQQLRRFIDNLCNYAEGKPVNLDGLIDEILWSQVKPLLDYNESKRQKRIDNGKKGGLAKASALKDTNQDLANATTVSEEGRKKNEEGRRLKVDGRMLKDELLKLKDKIEKYGWDSLSTSEAGYWHNNIDKAE